MDIAFFKRDRSAPLTGKPGPAVLVGRALDMYHK